MKYFINTYSSRGGSTGKVFGSNKRDLVREVQETRMPWLKKTDIAKMLRPNMEDDLRLLKEFCEDGTLYYRHVHELVARFGLTLAEYGDGADYSNAAAYAYWNLTGNRHDMPLVRIEYDWDANGNAAVVKFLDWTLR